MRLVYNAHEQQKAAVVPQIPFVITEEAHVGFRGVGLQGSGWRF
jgi:hypothetical protein